MMKTLACLSTAVAMLTAIPAIAAPEPGTPAPAFEAKDTNGNAVSLSGLDDKVVVLEWTNHLCPFVQKHYESGNMQSLQKDVTGDGAVWLTVISSAPGKQGHVSPDEANELTATRDAAPSHVILDEDGSLGQLYGATATPHMVVIRPDQTVAYMGAIDSIPSASQADIPKAENYVREAYTAVASGGEVAKPVTKAYGCSVKYQ
jgi:peroxiredoxin